MAKYRKIALVEAEQFLPPHQIPEGCYQKGTIGDVAHGHGEWFLKTLEGEHGPLRYADYICIGVQGERWNVERSIFESSYEPATSGSIRYALERITDLSERWTNSLVSQINEIARCALSEDEHATPAPAVDANEELQRGKDEIRSLIESIWRAEFRKEAPNWKPLDDLPGMISQMDNMYAGVRSQRDQARWDLHNPPAVDAVPAGEGKA